MNILITGCNGQLGNEIQLLQAQYAQHTWFNTDVNELDITDKAAIEQVAAASPEVARIGEGKTPKRIIVVPGRLVNVVL